MLIELRGTIASGQTTELRKERPHSATLQNANPSVTFGSRALRAGGRVVAVGGLAYAGYNIYQAPPGRTDNVVAREAGGFGGAIAGGGGLATLGLGCGPAAVVCAPVGGIIGAIIGGIVGEEVVGGAYDAAESFFFESEP